MILSIVVASLVVSAPVRCVESGVTPGRDVAPDGAIAAGRVVVPDSTLVALYESGEHFETFLASTRARRALWSRNWTDGTVSSELVDRARAIPGRWRLLVAAVDGCSDSANTVPYLARLVALVPSLEMRIVAPEAGKAVMESHRTPDGRAATPTVVVLDEAGKDVGCFVERPSALQAMAMRARAEEAYEEFARGKQSWYDADAGSSTVREVVAVLEAAAAGRPICGAASESSASSASSVPE